MADQNKNAKLTLKLRADSGYSADDESRISAEQWGKICAVIAGTDSPSAAKACPRGCTSPEQGGSGCVAVTGDCSDLAAPAVPAVESLPRYEPNEQVLGFMQDSGVGEYVRLADVQALLAAHPADAGAARQPHASPKFDEAAEIKSCVAWAKVFYRHADGFEENDLEVAEAAWVERARRAIQAAPEATSEQMGGAERPQKITLQCGSTLRYEARTTGEPGWLLYDPKGKLAFGLSRIDTDMIEATIAATLASHPVEQIGGAQVATADAWMRSNLKECTTAASKKWMENAGFGVWGKIAADYTIPLFFTPTTGRAVEEQATERKPLTDAEIFDGWQKTGGIGSGK